MEMEYRDTVTMSMTENVIKFTTKYNPPFSKYDLRYKKEEVLTFESEIEARIYFNNEMEELNKHLKT